MEAWEDKYPWACRIRTKVEGGEPELYLTCMYCDSEVPLMYMGESEKCPKCGFGKEKKDERDGE